MILVCQVKSNCSNASQERFRQQEETWWTAAGQDDFLATDSEDEEEAGDDAASTTSGAARRQTKNQVVAGLRVMRDGVIQQANGLSMIINVSLSRFIMLYLLSCHLSCKSVQCKPLQCS